MAGKHIEYTVEDDLNDALADCLSSSPKFSLLRDNLKIVGCYVVRMDENEQTVPGKGEPIMLKKVPADMQVFMKPKAHFIVVVDYHFWNHTPAHERTSLLMRALMRITVEKVDDGLKIGTRKYDVQDFVANVQANGAYTEPLRELREALTRRAIDMVQSSPAVQAETQAEEPVEEPAQPPAPPRRKTAAPKVQTKTPEPVEDSVPPRRARRPAPAPEPEADPESDDVPPEPEDS